MPNRASKYNATAHGRMQDKDCLVYFRLKDDGMGMYGFDWISGSEASGRVALNGMDDNLATSPTNIGKYVGPAQWATVKYDRNEDQFVVETEPFDKDGFREDADRSEFATRYVIDHQCRFPVSDADGLCFYDYGLFVDYRKTVEFDYIYEDPMSGVKTAYHYGIKYEKGELQELTITLDSETVTFGKYQRNKATEKSVKEKWHTTKDLVKRIWNNYNMDAVSLPKDRTHIMNVKVDCGSYKILEIVKNDPVPCVDIFEYECCQLIRFTQIQMEWDEEEEDYVPVKYSFTGKQRIEKGINDKNLSVDRRCLIDPYLSVRALSQDVQNESVSATFVPASLQKFKLNTGQTVNQYGESCISVLQAEGDVEVVKVGENGVSKSIEHVTIAPFSDDGILHSYWEDDYVNERKFVVKNHLDEEPPTIEWYYFPTLSLSQFGKNDKATLKLEVKGTFDEIELIPSNENLQLSRRAIKSADDNELTVTLTGACDTDETITAMSNGVEVGHLDVKVLPACTFGICYVNVNIHKMNPKITVDTADLILPSSRKWSLEPYSHHKDIMAQGGCVILEEEGLEGTETIDFYETDDAQGTSEDVSFNPRDCSEYLTMDDEFGEKVFDREKSSVFGKSLPLFIDYHFLSDYPQYAGYLRVYILDKYMESFEGDSCGNCTNKTFYDSMVGVEQKEVVLLFKKSIEAHGGFNCETLAHELLHCFGLNHCFDNRERITFKMGTTTNVMDDVEEVHSLSRYQWEKLNKNLMTFAARLDSNAKRWEKRRKEK